MDRLGWSILFVLTGFAFVMRFWRLGEIPPGLFYDEAYNGLDALRLLEQPLSNWPVFLTGNHGREALFVWLTGFPHALFGQSIWTVRAVSALCGALFTPALAWLGWEAAPLLGVRHRRAFALWCGAVVLALLWSQIFARYGIRLALFVLIQVLFWSCVWRAWNQVSADRPDQTFTVALRGSVWWILAGLLAGLSLYTYLPARLLPLILIPLLVAAVWQHREQITGQWQTISLRFTVAIAVAVIVAAPLGIYFIQNPVSFMTRIGQVSIIGREDTGLLANVEPVIGMFAWTGDHNPRSNLPYRPVLDPLLLPFFVLGLATAVWRFWKLGRLWVLTGFFVMLLPTLLSEFAPNYQRAIGALPYVVVLIALGLETAVGLGETLWERGRPVYPLLGAVLLGASIIVTWHAYFVSWARSPDLFPAWDVGFTRIAEQIARTPEDVRVYVSPRGRDHPTLSYLMAQQGRPAPQGFDGRTCMRVTTDQEARYYFLVQEDPRSQALIDSYYPDSRPEAAVVETSGAMWANELERPADGEVVFPEMQPMRAALGDGIEQVGYWHWPEAVQPGERFYTRFFWQVDAQPTESYTAFVQLLHRDQEGAWARLAGADRQPGNGTCPTTEWLPGEVVVDELQFIVPAQLPPGDLYLAAGFYTPDDGQRLQVPGNRPDQVLIGPIARTP